MATLCSYRKIKSTIKPASKNRFIDCSVENYFNFILVIKNEQAIDLKKHPN